MEIGIPENKLNKAHSINRKRAFSLIEVLLVLALVAVLVGIVAGNAGSFIVGANFEPPDRVLKKAVLDAVYHASESKEASYLSYFEDNATFIVQDASGGRLAIHKVYQKINDKIRDDSLIPEIKFYAIGPLAGEGGGDTKYDKDELYMERVFFHSGCSVPFFAEIKFRGEESVIHFDPFSGYSLKTDK